MSERDDDLKQSLDLSYEVMTLRLLTKRGNNIDDLAEDSGFETAIRHLLCDQSPKLSTDVYHLTVLHCERLFKLETALWDGNMDDGCLDIDYEHCKKHPTRHAS